MTAPDTKQCQGCPATLFRRDTDTNNIWARRKYCKRGCGNRQRSPDPSQEAIESQAREIREARYRKGKV